MLPELGQIALLLALVAAALQTLLPLLGAQRGLAPWMATARPAAYAQWALLLVAWLTVPDAQADDPQSIAPSLRDEFACPGMHAEWLDDKTVQCLREKP